MPVVVPYRAMIVGADEAPASNTTRPRATAPSWARWNGGLDQRYTLGVEEEVMLLDPLDWSLAQSSDQVLPLLSDELSAHMSPETHAAVLELATGVHDDVDGAVAELAALRSRLADELRPAGLTVAAAGMHPLTVWDETEISGAPRYRLLDESMRLLARREPTMALHVHVGVPAPEDAIRVLNALRRSSPIVLALSANSPMWQGRDGGLRIDTDPAVPGVSAQRPAALLRRLRGLRAGDRCADRLLGDPRPELRVVGRAIAAGARHRRDAHHGRAVDLDDVAPLVALIQSIARLELEGDPSSDVPSPPKSSPRTASWPPATGWTPS